MYFLFNKSSLIEFFGRGTQFESKKAQDGYGYFQLKQPKGPHHIDLHQYLTTQPACLRSLILPEFLGPKFRDLILSLVRLFAKKYSQKSINDTLKPDETRQNLRHIGGARHCPSLWWRINNNWASKNSKVVDEILTALPGLTESVIY